ncbi:TVP38/TMEM64 family protein [Heyndrickxia sp. NPDC080065]|uniref:TVP38/TMEM64 family protein n=1 Tax=Heyndrickxia sp. NPDC080065 TaxID=3390568 RepID=UPI003D00A24A
MGKKIFLVFIWAIFIYFLKQNHLLSIDIDALKQFISGYPKYTFFIFIGLWVFRLLIFLPGSTLMILGGICLGPTIGFTLSMVGMVISESLVFMMAKTFTSARINHYLNVKQPRLKGLLETYHYKFLALGVICPILPTDVICYLSASMGISYPLYLLTIIISNIPMMALYSTLGGSFGESVSGIVVSIIMIVGITAISLNILKKLKSEANSQNG